MTRLAWILVALLLESNLAFASKMSFSVGSSHFSISVPESWTTLKEVMGVPVLIVGPSSNGRRPSIAISPSDLDSTKFTLEQLKDSESGYRKEKEEFLAKTNGKLEKFFPFQRLRWSKEIDAATLAIQYEVAGHEFVDRTYYLACKGKLYHVKTLILVDHGREVADQVEAATRSFRCR